MVLVNVFGLFLMMCVVSSLSNCSRIMMCMRMYEEYAAGTLSLDNYKNKKQEYDRKIAEVQDKIEQFEVEEAAQSVVPETVRAAAEQAENFLHGTRLTASMVSAFIENVYVHPVPAAGAWRPLCGCGWITDCP